MMASPIRSEADQQGGGETRIRPANGLSMWVSRDHQETARGFQQQKKNHRPKQVNWCNLGTDGTLVASFVDLGGTQYRHLSTWVW